MKKCENPIIPELTKTCKSRVYNLGSIKLPEGLSKKCVWCLKSLTGRQRRWCGEDCVHAAQAWGNPQGEQGLYILLLRQNFKCNTCQFDYGAIIDEMYQQPKIPYGMAEYKDTWRTKFSYWVITKLKQHMHDKDLAHRPEVDHIVPIYKGGLPLDIENLNCLCFACHKAKTKIDLSGKRSK